MTKQQTMTHQQNHVNGDNIPRNRKSPKKKKEKETIIEVLVNHTHKGLFVQEKRKSEAKANQQEISTFN